MNWHAEANPFTAMFRMASGAVIGLIFATVVQIISHKTSGFDLARDGMVAGSFFGMLTTLGKTV